MSSCVCAVVISLACNKHLSPRHLTHNHSLDYITLFSLLCQASYLQWESEHLQQEAEHLEAKGLQKIECVVAGLKAERLYNDLQVARTKLEHSMSGGLPLPKRHRCAPTIMASSPTAQELKAMASDLSAQEHGATALDPTAQEFEGDMSELEALPHLSPIP